MKEQYSDFEVKKKVLKPLEVEGRIIYPIIEVLSSQTIFDALNVSPVALIVEENGDKYVLQLSYGEIDEDELFEIFEAFKYK